MRCMDVSVKIKLGKRLRQLRKQAGLTQEKLATASGIDYKYLQKIEGKSPPSVRIDTMFSLAKALKITLKELLDFQN